MDHCNVEPEYAELPPEPTLGEALSYFDEVAPLTPEEIALLDASVASDPETCAEHDRQALVGDIPAPPEVDDTETAAYGQSMSPRLTAAVQDVIAEIEAAP